MKVTAFDDSPASPSSAHTIVQYVAGRAMISSAPALPCARGARSESLEQMNNGQLIDADEAL